MVVVETSAIQAAAAATTATYRSFADATRSVLDLLERHLPESVLFLAHLDRGPVHPSHRRRPQRVGRRAALQPRDPARRRVLLAHGGGPRAAHVQRGRPPPDLLDAADAGARRRPRLPRRAARALRRHARRLARRAAPLGGAVHRGRRAALRDAGARALLRAGAREQRARPAALQRHAARPGTRDGRRRPRRAGAGDRRRRAHRGLRGGLRDRRRARRLPARAGRPRLRLDRHGRRRDRAGDDPAARRDAVRPRPRVHLQGDLLRRRRALAPGARGAAGGGDRRPLGRVRAGAARRPGGRRADRDLAGGRWRRSRTRRPACCGCWPRRPRWRSSTPRCAAGWARWR